jgi:hypothetical protein
MTVGLFCILFGTFLINPGHFKSRLNAFVNKNNDVKLSGFTVQNELSELLFTETVEFNLTKPDAVKADIFVDATLRQLV